MDKCRIVIWILGIISFIFIILTSIFTIWTHVSLQVLFYISFFALCSIYIFILLIEISIYGKYLKNLKNKFENHINLFTLIFLFLVIFFYIIFLINIFRFQKFIINCPFCLDKLDHDLNFDRRCELYDINYNSRFSYQYICSYDSSKDFSNINKKKLKQKVNPDNVICIKFNELIDNTIINNFKDVYNKKDIFYCSRTNMPQESDFSFVKSKHCRMSKYKLVVSFDLIALFQYIYPLLFMISFYKFIRNRFRDRNDHIPIRNYRLERAIYRIHEDLINLGRSLNIVRNKVNLNNANSSNTSTKGNENPVQDNDFRPEKTSKNISSEKTNKMVNHTNSVNINSEGFNSEEIKIRVSNFKDNNINK